MSTDNSGTLKCPVAQLRAPNYYFVVSPPLPSFAWGIPQPLNIFSTHSH